MAGTTNTGLAVRAVLFLLLDNGDGANVLMREGAR
jgi:hypothetical protein